MKLAWHLRPKQIGPLTFNLHCTETACDGILIVASKQTREVSFGEKLKKIVKDAVPSIFKDKVGFLPLWKWVHEIDTRDAKPIR